MKLQLKEENRPQLRQCERLTYTIYITFINMQHLNCERKIEVSFSSFDCMEIGFLYHL